MKKLILSVTLLGMVATATAQKNTLLVAGNVSYEDDDTSNTKTYEFSPKVGYQFSDHWTAGIESAMGKIDADEYESNSFSLGGFVRYSQPLSEQFAVYADLGAGYQRIEEDYTDSAQFDADGFYASLTPNLFINFKNGFGLNFNIGGVGYGQFDGDDYERSDFNVNFGKSVGFGISKNFGLK